VYSFGSATLEQIPPKRKREVQEKGQMIAKQEQHASTKFGS
jgi:hypothetical protein